jgi:two-component system nitrate/nitrite response regulator NarL
MSSVRRPSPSRGLSPSAPSRGVAVGDDTGLSVLLVERDGMARRGLTQILTADPGLRVTGSVARIDEAEYLSAATPVEVILAGGDVPDMHGRHGIARLLTRFAAARVVVLSDDLSPLSITTALQAGADGYLPRTIAAGALVRSLQGVRRGETALSRALVHVVVTALRAGGPVTSTADLLTFLSPREREVMLEMSRGRSNAEIAADFGLSASTVKTHVTNILRKTGTRTRYALQPAASPASASA